VVGYVELGNGAEAVRRAGYSPRNARFQSSHPLTKPNIGFAIARARKTIETSTTIRADEIAYRWWFIANVSPADVIQSRDVACRYCHGTDHEYQWRTPRDALDAKLTEVYASQDARESVDALIVMGDWQALPLAKREATAIAPRLSLTRAARSAMASATDATGWPTHATSATPRWPCSMA